jgi:hypothetical protein
MLVCKLHPVEPRHIMCHSRRVALYSFFFQYSVRFTRPYYLQCIYILTYVYTAIRNKHVLTRQYNQCYNQIILLFVFKVLLTTTTGYKDLGIYHKSTRVFNVTQQA